MITFNLVIILMNDLATLLPKNYIFTGEYNTFISPQSDIFEYNNQTNNTKYYQRWLSIIQAR